MWYDISIEEQDIVIQEGIKNLCSDLEIPLETGTNFWKLVDENKYYNLKKEILKLYSRFGTTYNSEVDFSDIKIIVDKLRNKFSDRHIADLIQRRY